MKEHILYPLKNLVEEHFFQKWYVTWPHISLFLTKILVQSIERKFVSSHILVQYPWFWLLMCINSNYVNVVNMLMIFMLSWWSSWGFDKNVIDIDIMLSWWYRWYGQHDNDTLILIMSITLLWWYWLDGIKHFLISMIMVTLIWCRWWFWDMNFIWWY